MAEYTNEDEALTWFRVKAGFIALNQKYATESNDLIRNHADEYKAIDFIHTLAYLKGLTLGLGAFYRLMRNESLVDIAEEIDAVTEEYLHFSERNQDGTQ